MGNRQWSLGTGAVLAALVIAAPAHADAVRSSAFGDRAQPAAAQYGSNPSPGNPIGPSSGGPGGGPKSVGLAAGVGTTSSPVRGTAGHCPGLAAGAAVRHGPIAHAACPPGGHRELGAAGGAGANPSASAGTHTGVRAVSGGNLPFTGLDLLTIVLAGLLLIALGLLLRAAARGRADAARTARDLRAWRRGRRLLRESRRRGLSA